MKLKTHAGAPCKHCRGTLRYIRNNACARCARAYARMEYSQFPELQITASAQWHSDNAARHNEAMRAGQLNRKFGISAADYDRLLASQNGACAICKRKCPTGRRLAVDHDHVTGIVRGLLCQGCNTGLGKFGDDQGRLRAAADYLQSRELSARLGLIHSAEEQRDTSTAYPVTE